MKILIMIILVLLSYSNINNYFRYRRNNIFNMFVKYIIIFKNNVSHPILILSSYLIYMFIVCFIIDYNLRQSIS